ncbi:YbaY family lipoprotein [Lentisalinibacter sediminis]|uniref:YbaY family lipoprotein n=1 Tax=Lentisalinibacter sediminis TaxID=2992237 RepID=UPI00386B5778
MSTLRGEVFYLERIALPPGAKVTVELQDVSRADAPAMVLASTRFAAEGVPPYPFELTYDPADIDGRMNYALRATITRGDELLFATNSRHPAFATEEHALRVRKVEASADTGEASPALTGRDWMLMRLEGEEVAPLSDGRRPSLQFEADRVHGFAGCNRLTGGYRTDGAALDFAQLAMTRMACAEGMDLEQRFSAALERVTGYAIEGGRLLLLDTEGDTLAELEG